MTTNGDTGLQCVTDEALAFLAGCTNKFMLLHSFRLIIGYVGKEQSGNVIKN